MSNIYNQEPQAYGHIRFVTTFGDLDIELFTKQCPRATRNFTQLCLDGHYKNTVFDRIEKDFIAIGGSKANDDDDDEDEYFQDEFHSRLRFNRRGLLATANTKKDQNGPRFFFTLGSTPELQNKHTIFGRLKGNTVYALVDLNECQVDEDFTPYSEQKITDVIVIENPYPELEPRIYKQNNVQTNSDLTDSKINNPLAGPKVKQTSKKLIYHDEDSDDNSDSEVVQNSKLNHKSNDGNFKEYILEERLDEQIIHNEHNDLIQESEQKNLDICESSPKQSNANPKEEKLRQIKAQIEALREQIESQTETKTLKQRTIDRSNNKIFENSDTSINSSSTKEFESTTKSKKKNKDREKETLELVSNFRKRLKEATKESVKVNIRDNEKSKYESDDELSALDRVDGDEWLKHEFNPGDDDGDLRMAKDANMKGDDWYTIEDPRHRSHYNRHDRKHSDSRLKDRDSRKHKR